jgi:hypothetical protein
MRRALRQKADRKCQAVHVELPESFVQNSEDLEGVPRKPESVGAAKPAVRRNQSDGVSAPKNQPPAEEAGGQ